MKVVGKRKEKGKGRKISFSREQVNGSAAG
jgi:hypothetical protein